MNKNNFNDISEFLDFDYMILKFKNGEKIATDWIISLEIVEEKNGDFTIDVNFGANSRKLYKMFKEEVSCEITLSYKSFDVMEIYGPDYVLNFSDVEITRYKQDYSNQGAIVRFENAKKI